MRHAAFADVLFGNPLYLKKGVIGGTIGAKVADVEKTPYTRFGGHLCQVISTTRVGCQDIGPCPLVFSAGEVIDDIDPAQGGAQTTLVVQTDDRHFHGDAAWKIWGARRRANQCTHLLPIGYQLAHQSASHKAGTTGDQNHERDYKPHSTA